MPRYTYQRCRMGSVPSSMETAWILMGLVSVSTSDLVTNTIFGYTNWITSQCAFARSP